MLKMPKIKPTADPDKGPARTAAMIAGICIIVSAAPPNQGMKPQWVQPRKTAMAAIRPVITSAWVVFFSFMIVTSKMNSLNIITNFKGLIEGDEKL